MGRVRRKSSPGAKKKKRDEVELSYDENLLQVTTYKQGLSHVTATPVTSSIKYFHFQYDIY